MSLRYAPGTTPVVVTPFGFVVLDAATPASLAARIRSLVAHDRGLGGVIEALTDAHGASLTAIPPFAVALVEGDSVRFAVRGDLTLVVEARERPVEMSGSGVTTWTERTIPGVTRISAVIGSSTSPAELPVLDGVVLASVIEWDATTAGPDELWGETIVRRPAGAPLQDVADAADADPGAIDQVAGDHDGETISLAQAKAMRAAAGAVPDPGAGPTPLAPARPPAPGRLRLSSGQLVVLDRTVVIGRRPRSTRVTGTDLPHLVAVDSPQQDISRSHVELRAEGESIVATDLRTTNGTTLLRQGADPLRLHPGEATVVVPGDVLDLGDGVTVAVEGLP